MNQENNSLRRVAAALVSFPDRMRAEQKIYSAASVKRLSIWKNFLVNGRKCLPGCRTQPQGRENCAFLQHVETCVLAVNALTKTACCGTLKIKI
jgi:hypothetical protein